tara:strand:+ start:2196 stop:2411 length:216 start_codon:yes stop_codon:yes gene_type:complete
MALYITQEGDVLDQICYDQLGSESYLIELLELNRTCDLTQYGGPLPAGIELTLPKRKRVNVKVQPSISLFD